MCFKCNHDECVSFFCICLSLLWCFLFLLLLFLQCRDIGYSILITCTFHIGDSINDDVIRFGSLLLSLSHSLVSFRLIPFSHFDVEFEFVTNVDLLFSSQNYLWKGKKTYIIRWNYDGPGKHNLEVDTNNRMTGYDFSFLWFHFSRYF